MEKIADIIFYSNFWVFLIGIVLFLLVMIAIGYIRKIKKFLIEKNELADFNRELQSLNNKYRNVCTALKEENLKLSEDKRKSNIYLVCFAKMCRDLIDSYSEYQKTARRLMKGLGTDMTDALISQAETEKQTRELYAAFDAAFLDLFPDFVEKFNALLKEGMGYRLKNNRSLNPELRIFALRRLGIKDYSKIADFLHYKMHTVYNYRAEVKDRALSGREIELQVMEI